MKAARGGKKGICIPSIWVHGSGRHSMCEHACSDKLTSSGACGFNSLHRSPIRVCPPQERACTFWQTGFQRRGRFSQPLPSHHLSVEKAMGHRGARLMPHFLIRMAEPLSRSSIRGALRHSSTTGCLSLRISVGNYFAPTERLRCSPALIAASYIFFVVIKTDKDFFKNFQRAPLLALFLLYWM